MSFAPLPLSGLQGSHLARTTDYFSQYQPLQLKGSIQMNAVGGTPTTSAVGSFQQVLGQSFQQLNQTVQAPEALMQQAMSGGPADIHDVVMASTQAELAVSITTTAMGKLIQAYDRVSQIQI
jgi:flagellar hook-basal body complex protein FliE